MNVKKGTTRILKMLTTWLNILIKKKDQKNLQERYKRKNYRKKKNYKKKKIKNPKQIMNKKRKRMTKKIMSKKIKKVKIKIKIRKEDEKINKKLN